MSDLIVCVKRKIFIFTMRMLLFVMVVVNVYSNWPRKAKILRSNVESQVKVTRKVIGCRKTKCHNFKTNGETPMRLQHLAAKIFPENLCISLVNRAVHRWSAHTEIIQSLHIISIIVLMFSSRPPLFHCFVVLA